MDRRTDREVPNRQTRICKDSQEYVQTDTQTFENMENSHTDVQKGWTDKQTRGKMDYNTNRST